MRTLRLGAILACLAAAACGSTTGEGEAPLASAQERLTCPTGTVIRGIDVTHFAGTIDWSAVRASGVVFAMAKATEANTVVDANFATYRQNAEAAGVAFGAYHLLNASDDPIVQA